MKLNWNSRGVGGGLRNNPFHRGGMDIFWNYTIPVSHFKTLDCLGVNVHP